MKKKLLVILLVLMLSAVMASASGDTPNTALTVDSQETVYSVYACYEVLGDYASITVDFADAVEAYAYSNFVGGKLYISVASASEIDVSSAVAKASAEDAEGNKLAPKLKMVKCTINGVLQEITTPAEKTYTYTFSNQLCLIEPWFLKSNAYLNMKNGVSTMTEKELSALYDYGAWFVSASAFEDSDVLPAAEEIVSNSAAILYSRENGRAKIEKGTAGYMITASYVEGIYTYELNEPLYVVFFVEDDYGIHYSSVKKRNLLDIAKKGMTSNFTDTEKAVYARMAEMEQTIVSHRATFETIPSLPLQTAPLITAGQFGSYTVDGTLNARNSSNIVLIEPWGVRSNAYMTNATYEESGFVMFRDKSDKYASVPSVEELLAEVDAYVFSTSNGNAETSKSGGYYVVSAIYRKDIFTYQMNDNIYVVPFVKKNGAYIFGSVKTRNILSMIEKNVDNTTYPETERNVYRAMINMHYDVVAHRATFGLYD